MIIRLFALTLTVAFGCNVATVAAQETLTLEERVAARRAARLQQTETVPVHTPVNLSAMERRSAERRAQRLNNAPLPLKIALINAVNMQRARMGLPALRPNMLLEKAAMSHAQDMKTRDYFAHENPEGLRSQDRIKATGYGVINAQECHCRYEAYFGENLAKGQRTVAEVIEDWMASPPHREAILEREFMEIGVGIVDDLWVLNFGGVTITSGGAR